MMEVILLFYLNVCRYNNYDRSAINTVPHDVVQRWYTAHRHLTTELRRAENELWVKLKPGKVCRSIVCACHHPEQKAEL